MDTDQVLADTTISISELKQNPMAVIKQGKGFPVAVLKNNVPVFYAVGVLGILPPNTAKTVEGPVFTGLQATINFNLARVSVSSSAFGSKNEQNQATINSHCR
ncbi:hypothetical protein [Methylophaga sp.]|uniref:hypothetical protein n=1 Tax=Methylophaga sp. TaxID=2024840 RepID=UPI003A8CE689